MPLPTFTKFLLSPVLCPHSSILNGSTNEWTGGPEGQGGPWVCKAGAERPVWGEWQVQGSEGREGGLRSRLTKASVRP